MAPSTKDKGKVSTSQSRIRAKSVGLITESVRSSVGLGSAWVIPTPAPNQGGIEC
jgi:hypothetical protein